MNYIIRIPQVLYRQVIADLKRPHPYAAERVGFLFARPGTLSDGDALLLAYQYRPVADNQYVRDYRSGARIGSDAIRGTLQGILDGAGSAFHVHLHNHRGQTRLSPMDQAEIPKLVTSFQSAGPLEPHGLIIFSADSAIGRIWAPGQRVAIRAAQIAVIGAPMLLWEEKNA